VARAEVLAPFAAQVNNGHVLDQTIWNWYFEPGTDRLTGAGYAKLDSLAQVRPGPDPRLYLQAARDVSAVAAAGGVDTIAARREDLTARRAAAVQAYMNTQPAINPVAYEIFVHDPVVVGINADFSERAFRGQAIGYRGGIGGGAGVTATSTGSGGPTPAASSIGTGTGGPSAGGTSGGATGTPGSGPGGGAGPGAPY
jgi:hypothetical protein